MLVAGSTGPPNHLGTAISLDLISRYFATPRLLLIECEGCGCSFSNPLQKRAHSCTQQYTEEPAAVLAAPRSLPALATKSPQHPDSARRVSSSRNRQETESMADSAALEGWRNVQHLQFQAFAAATTSTPVITSVRWYRRNALINRIALVCKGQCRKLLCSPQRWFVHRLVASSRAGRRACH